MQLADISAEYVDHMGSDIDVVDAARVSFHKESDWEWVNIYGAEEPRLSEADTKLVWYLATHNHWSPFAHCTVKFRVKAPIFVARQLVKHTVGFSWNEVSRRYVDDGLEFYLPNKFRRRSESAKQGSSVDTVPVIGNEKLYNPTKVAEDVTRNCLEWYEMMIRGGVCPEQARMLLPQNTMTEWIWTGTLYAWSRMCTLRLDKHTQRETQEVAKLISTEMSTLFPVSWEALLDTPKEKVCALLS